MTRVFLLGGVEFVDQWFRQTFFVDERHLYWEYHMRIKVRLLDFGRHPANDPANRKIHETNTAIQSTSLQGEVLPDLLGKKNIFA